MDKSFKELIGKYAVRGWGTYLDDVGLKGISPKAIGASFTETDHSVIQRFEKLSIKEKWEFGYWAESKASRTGILIGVVLGFFLGCSFMIFLDQIH